MKSTYKHLCRNDFGGNYKKIWKAKILLKVKIFMWLLVDNLCGCNWRGNESCAFCTEKESVRHIFFECVTVKYIWSLIAFVFGANCRPGNFDQYLVWIGNSLPQGQRVYAMGLIAISWAIWRTINSICFDQKK